MAIATGTAIGLGITAAATGASFAQSANQKKQQRKAENEAAKFLADARKKLDINFYEQLGIQKEPYELEREALLSQGAQAIQAGVESERGAAATAGRVQMAQQAGQRQIAAAMGQEMLGLEKLATAEDARLRDMQANLDIRESAGAQKAAAVAEARSAQALSQGLQGIASLGQQVTAALPDYKTSSSMKELNKMQKMATQKYNLSQGDLQKSIASMGTVDGVDLSKVGGMSEIQFKAFMDTVDPNVLKKITGQLPNSAQSFRPSEFTLPAPTSSLPSYAPWASPSIGG
jgi:hypothetical protein